MLVDLETPTIEELDPNFIVIYNIAEYDVINRVLLANKTSPSLEPLWQKAREQSLDYELVNDKLLFQGRLEVPVEPPELRMMLIRHVHSQLLVIYIRIRKMKALLSRKYY